MTPLPCLSVVIPAFNARDYIIRALRSLAGQTRTDFEIIVVDDGSSDGTCDIVRAFAANLSSDGPQISLIQQSNQGVSVARNRGIEASRSDLIGFLDADDVWAQEKAAVHVGMMAANLSIDLSFSGFRYINAENEDLYEGYSPQAGEVSLQRLMSGNIIHTSTVVARRDALRACGGFDAALITNEDFDLWLKIAAWRTGNIHAFSARLADYRRHDAQVTRDWRSMHEGWKKVVSRLEREHPVEWAKVARSAWGHQLEYNASLAFNAGDIQATRRLMRLAWRKAGLRLALQRDALLMTGIAVATYLPRGFQIKLGSVVAAIRKAAL